VILCVLSYDDDNDDDYYYYYYFCSFYCLPSANKRVHLIVTSFVRCDENRTNCSHVHSNHHTLGQRLWTEDHTLTEFFFTLLLHFLTLNFALLSAFGQEILLFVRMRTENVLKHGRYVPFTEMSTLS